MDMIFEDLKKYVEDGYTPIPNMLIDYPTKGNDGVEFSGFMMVCFSYAWQAMVESEGTSDWKVSTKKLKKQKGFTNNKCRKFFLRALSLGIAKDFLEHNDGEMIIKVNPMVYTEEKIEDLKQLFESKK